MTWILSALRFTLLQTFLAYLVNFVLVIHVQFFSEPYHVHEDLHQVWLRLQFNQEPTKAIKCGKRNSPTASLWERKMEICLLETFLI